MTMDKIVLIKLSEDSRSILATVRLERVKGRKGLYNEYLGYESRQIITATDNVIGEINGHIRLGFTIKEIS